MIFILASEEEFWQTAQGDAVFSIKETLKKYPTCRIGLAGGQTPRVLYERLAKVKLPWEKIELIQLDERFVPSDHEQSNLRMIRRALLNHIPLPPVNLIAFDTSLAYESAAKEMHRRLSALLRTRTPLFDLLILGAGADGHIASLFEGEEAVIENALTTKKLASTSQAKGYEIEDRLTVSLHALKNSNRALLLLKGKEKQQVAAVFEGEATEPKCTALKELKKAITLKTLVYFGS